MKIKFYYQIDYIDENGLANYIDTFKSNELDKAKYNWKKLSDALACIRKDTKFVLDLYAFVEDENGTVENTDILITQVLPEVELKI